MCNNIIYSDRSVTHSTLSSQVDSREEVSELLSLHDQIDLLFPRGGKNLVHSVTEQAQGKIPVLGHTEGICHVYLDKDADLSKALNVGEQSNQGLLRLMHSKQNRDELLSYYCNFEFFFSC